MPEHIVMIHQQVVAGNIHITDGKGTAVIDDDIIAKLQLMPIHLPHCERGGVRKTVQLERAIVNRVPNDTVGIVQIRK